MDQSRVDAVVVASAFMLFATSIGLALTPVASDGKATGDLGSPDATSLDDAQPVPTLLSEGTMVPYEQPVLSAVWEDTLVPYEPPVVGVPVAETKEEPKEKPKPPEEPTCKYRTRRTCEQRNENGTCSLWVTECYCSPPGCDCGC